MKHGNMLTFVVIIIAVLSVLSFLGPIGSSNPQQISVQALNSGPLMRSGDNVSSGLISAGFHPFERMSPNTDLHLVIGIMPANLPLLNQYATEINSPGSPLYRHWLSEDQINSLFGNYQAQSTVESYFRGMGFSVSSSTPFAVDLSGNVSLIEKTFHTDLYYFENSSGNVLFANMGSIELPASIGRYIISVDGLTNMQMTSNPVYPTLKGTYDAPRLSPTTPGGPINLTHPQVVGFYAKKYVWAQLPLTNGPYPGSNITGYTPPFQALFPSDLVWIYGIGRVLNGTAGEPGANGTGTTIAIVMGTGYVNATLAYPAWNYNDMVKYGEEVFGNASAIVGRVTYLNASGITHQAPPNPSPYIYVPYTDGYLGEFTLDTQYSATVAPKAHLDIMAIPSLSTVALDHAYIRLYNLSKVPQVITNSWSGSEDSWWNMYGPTWQSADLMNLLFELLSMRGSTIVAATGDSGGYDGYTNMISGEFPGTSPWVTGVGGNQVTMFNQTGVEFPVTGMYSRFNVTFGTANYSSAPPYYWPDLNMNVVSIGLSHDHGFTQAYWDNNQYTVVNGTPQVISTGAGSAALSIFFKQPWWQHGYLVPNTGRMSEVEVSAEAGFNQTELIDGDWGSWFFGGTSEATPTTAGMIADIISYLNATIHVDYLGDINPLLYELGNEYSQNPARIPDPYFTVSNGTNPLSAMMVNLSYTLDGPQNYPSNYYTTTDGYSMLTGWGTINVPNFMNDTKMFLTQPFNITPDREKGNFSLYGNVTASSLITMGQPSGLQASTTYYFNVSGNDSRITNAPKSLNLTFMTASGQIIALQNSTVPGPYNFSYSGGMLKIYNKTFMEQGFLEINGTYDNHLSYAFTWIGQKQIANASDSKIMSEKLSVHAEYDHLMGGFPAFDYSGSFNSSYGYFGTFEPPIEPNMQIVNVSFNGTPVYNALVLLSYNSSLNVSNLNVDNNSKLLMTNVTSYGLTNLKGQAFLDTWNVAHDTRIYVYAVYSGMVNETSFVLTPQITANILFSNPVENYLLDNEVSYLPVAQGQYLPFNVGIPNAQVALYVPGSLNFYGPSTPTMMLPGTVQYTNATGYVNYKIPNSLPPGTVLYLGITNSSAPVYQAANGLYLDHDVSYLTLLTIGSGPSVSLFSNAVDNIYGVPVVTPSTTFEALYSEALYSDYLSPIGAYINYMWYSVNGMKPISFGQDGQAVQAAQQVQVFGLNSSLPSGLDTITVYYNDTLGIEYSASMEFYYAASVPSPSVSLSGPSYAYGIFNIAYSSSVNLNLTSAYSITVYYNGNAVTTIQPTAKSGTIAVNGSMLPYGMLTFNLTEVTATGSYNYTSINMVNVPASQFYPTATIYTPASNTTVYGSVNVSFSYTGYDVNAVIFVNSSSGSVMTKNVTGTNYASFQATSPGSYTVTLLVTSPDGQHAKTTVTFEVSKPVKAVPSSVVFEYLVIGVVAGLIVGSIAVVALLRRH
ncbi:hypothetical protein DMB44_08145 [Thermoplasma sp. Kam2015]|uniref:protease pro-enzyme activation domain-containing protein n=1 Tax=Thermoplasma sp. Kam2015 TaxID=2094122 RepID=UPI000D9B8EFB|nr:protease pro-enzyme activation domain-containing protein [Thermoplasma sp. Kam2015]PYB67637.1 hypothetical protein DMB44_08145 [Thermoplasma sp. Kam2015]